MDRRTLTSAPPASPIATSERGLGDRVRRLRNARGLTQSELAAARVSKEYISQIETGKTRPTSQMLDWLADRSGESCDRLRAHILEWRSRCYRRHRDWEAAREDIERALELAEALSDDETIAHVHFQASLVAERTGQWRRARALGERAKELYEAVDDPLNVSRLLNNLGGLTFMLGDTEQAVSLLKEAFRIALDVGEPIDGAHAVSSLAQVHLRSGEAELAERQARHALELLDGRVDFLDEIGSARLVLGRALLEQGRLDEAEQTFAEAEQGLLQLSSASHSAAAWTARGELALARGDDKEASTLFRRAAEALQENAI